LTKESIYDIINLEIDILALGGHMNTNLEYINVTIQERHYVKFLRWYQALLESDEQEREAIGVPDTQRRNLNVIDLAFDAAHMIGADQRPVSLSELHEAYLQMNPSIGKGVTRESFGATINFHTINMRSRFPDANNKKRPAPWLSRPVFQRVTHGKYKLLSEAEIERFRYRVEQDDTRIFQDEYDLTDLT
jgi:hypothetical protein